MGIVPLKRCSSCRAWLDRSLFHKRARSVDGLQANCKDCAKGATTAWWRNRGASAHRAYHLGWRARHPGATARANRAHYWRNRDAQVARVMAYRAANHERMRAYEREWQRLNGKVAEYNHRRRARLNGAPRVPFTHAQFVAKMAYWGNRCWLCGIPAYHVDHVKPLSKGGPHALCNLRPICGSCNSKKKNRWPYPPAA
jgi:5-methylcytosine-specific restriction endonuclease McrA